MDMHLEDWSLAFAPGQGGSVTRCAYKGLDILRPALAPASSLGSSAFPMVPFIGRITKGSFTFQGEPVSLLANMPPEPHAIHGLGWQSPWVFEAGHDLVRLTHTYKGDADWPWSYTATQIFKVRENTLSLDMTLTNTSAHAMPAGLGWHPYFPKSGALIKADLTKVWLGDDGFIIGHQPMPLSTDTDLRQQRPVDKLNLDHCYSSGEKSTILSWPERGLKVDIQSSEALRHLTVFVPPGEGFFCVEPVSHVPDAVNSHLPSGQTGLRVLAAGQSLSASIKLSIFLEVDHPAS